MITASEGRRVEDGDVALDLKGVFAAIGRRWATILAITLVVGVGTFAVLGLIPPRYQAETKLLIENREVSLARDPAGQTDRVLIDQETVASQVQLLTSRDLARRVAQRHGLADLREFDGSSLGLLEGVMVALGVGRDPMRVSPEERMLDEFMKHLQVFRVEGSRVIVVQFYSRDRDLAAAVTNTIAEEFMALQGEAKRRTSEDQTRWLGDEISRLRDKVRDAEEQVERYRSGNDLFVGDNNATVARQQITDLNNALAAAQSDRATAESRAKLLDGLLKSGNLAQAADVLESETFRSLRAREIAIRSRMSELSVALLPGHPQIKALDSQIGDIARQQLAEARRVLATFRNDADVAASRIVRLTDQLNALKVTSAQNSESEVELRALEREAASQRNLLEGLLVRYREAVARQNAEVLPADARVISRAAVPTEPTFPKLVPLTAVATVAGFILAVTWIIAGEFLSGRALVPVAYEPMAPRSLRRERGADEADDGEVVDDRFAGPDEPPLELATDEASLDEIRDEAVEPAPRRAARRRATGEAADAASVAAEPVRSASAAERAERFRATIGRTVGAAAAVDPDPMPEPEPRPLPTEPDRAPLPVASLADIHALLVRDGASRIAFLGVAAARGMDRVIDTFSQIATADGARVVLVDLAPDRAGQGGAGLADLIDGTAAFGEIIRRDRTSRAHVIGVGSRPLDPEVYAGPDLETTLDALEHTYDLVVLDLGPMSSEPGRFTLVASADHVVLVGEPDQPTVMRAYDLLRRNGIDHLDVVSAANLTLGAVA